MRTIFALTSLAALAFASAASATPLSVERISYSPEFQTALNDDYGPREGVVLQNLVSDAVNGALTRRGANLGAPLTVEISIVDADPNRPTMYQLRENPDLDAIRSISIGGAELRAVLRSADGAVVGEITHRRYDATLEDALGSGTWSSARQAIRQFANKVADAYVAAQR